MDESREHGCCGKTSTRIVSTTLLLAFLFAGTSFCVLTAFSINQEEINKFCVSARCLRSAAEIIENLDRSQDPCTDLREFSCSKICKFPPPEERRPNLESYITEPITENDLPAVVMQKQFFQACMATESMGLNNERIFLQLIEELGGWPLLERNMWENKNFNWLDTMAKAVKIGLPFEWFLKFDLEGSYLKVQFPKDIQTMATRHYEKFMTDVTISMTGFDLNESIVSELIDIVTFANDLELVIKQSYPDDIEFGTLEDFNILFPQIKFYKTLQNMTGELWSVNTPMAYDIKNYIAKLDKLLSNTPPRTQANYIVWRIIEYFSPFLFVDIRVSHKHYLNKTIGVQGSRFQICLEDTQSRFRYVSEFAFIQNRATEEVRKTISEMNDLLIDSTLELIANSELPAEKQEHYTHLLSELLIDVGGQEEIFEEDFVKNYLHLDGNFSSSDNAIEIIVERNKMYTRTMFELIGKDARNAIYFQDNLAPDISVFPEDSRIIIPATLLQTSTFDRELPNYLRYAGLGVLLGRSISLLFNNSHDEEFLRRYNQCRNGIDSDAVILQNNFANLQGIEISYQAYENWTKTNGPEENLPGYLYDPQQVFWIKVSMNFCEEDFILNQISGFNRFRDDFNCSYLPEKNCSYF